jgi:hypothetical protein
MFADNGRDKETKNIRVVIRHHPVTRYGTLSHENVTTNKKTKNIWLDLQSSQSVQTDHIQLLDGRHCHCVVA